MELILDRGLEGPNTTGGKLWDISGPRDGATWLCATLEDKRRPGEPKVPGRTCIPTGRYPIQLRTEGGFHERYSNRFSWHQGMLWIRKVPDFQWILLHPGNTHGHTRGCPLTGERLDRNEDWDLIIPGGQATSAYKRAYLHIVPALLSGEEAWLTVTDHQLML